MRVRRLFHPEDYLVGENEAFYGDLAKKGWRLVSRGQQTSRFERCKPRDELYRVEIDYGEFDEDRLALYAECGWEFVTKRGYVNVFRAPAGSETPELYQDPREQAVTVKRMLRRNLISNLILLPVVALYLALILSLGSGWRGLGVGALKMTVLAPGVAAALLANLLYSLGVSLAGGLRLRVLYRRLRRGEPLDHTPKLRRRTVHKWVFVLVLILCFGTFVAQLASLRHTDLPEESDGDYIMLRDLGFDGERYYLFGNEDETRLERVWSPLADAVQTRESVAYRGSWVTMYQDIYRIRAGFLAEPFADMLIRDSIFARDPSEYRDIQVPGWDRVRLASMECVAQRGGDVVRVYLQLPGEWSWEEKEAVFVRALELIGVNLTEENK